MTIKNQDEQILVNEPFQYYSLISNPSFDAFKEMTDAPTKFVLNPFVREVLLANINGIDIKLTDRFYYLINMCRSVDDVNLAESADFFARELLAIVFRSSGTKQAFLKTLLTQYSISEQRTEERAYEEFKERKEEEEKSKWKFSLPKGKF